MAKRDHVGAVAGGLRRLRVGLDEKPVGPRRERRLGQYRRKLALTRRAIATASGQLYRVGGIEHDRIAKRLHDRDGAHIRDQIVVAEAGAPLGEDDFFVSTIGRLCGDLLHLVWREELALLEVYDLTGARGGGDEVGLAAEEGRNLQHVYHARCLFRLLLCMNIGDNGHADLVPYRRQDAKPGIKARAAPGLGGGAVGLVEARLEHVGDAKRGATALERPGNLQAKRPGLDDARPGEQEKLSRFIQRFPEGGGGHVWG